MSGHPLWPDDIEKKANAALDEILKTMAIAKPALQEFPALMAALKLLADEVRTELAALKNIRERTFGP